MPRLRAPPLLHLPPQPSLSSLSFSPPSFIPHHMPSPLSLSYLFLPIFSFLPCRPSAVALGRGRKWPRWRWHLLLLATTRSWTEAAGGRDGARRAWCRSGCCGGMHLLLLAAATAFTQRPLQAAARPTVVARGSGAATGAARLTTAAQPASAWDMARPR
ncbi:hypothetical protein PVAP13_2NG283106 [Panicum virgatum]|uniref:Uncharacterized protein n=1 Tax=Panicum virgatum TaxID=38727 RepID=A0A8T0VEZ7_PANVG|nr:hypothetical protein PVAP13_2NG283106 [Panicum virgatum]